LTRGSYLDWEERREKRRETLKKREDERREY